MSGNMSSLNDLGRPLRGRSSMLQSFLEEDEENISYEDDKDFWGNRLVLGALAEIVFSELPHPKLTPQVISNLQKFLVSVNTAASQASPFVLQESLPPGVTLSPELIQSLTPEVLLVLRTLINGYFRRQLTEIWAFWKPILITEGHQNLPEVPDDSCYQLIAKTTKSLREKNERLTTEVDELAKKRNEEMIKFARDAEEYRLLGVEILKEKQLQESVSFCEKRAEALSLERRLVKAEITLEKLTLEEEEFGTEEEQKERAKLYKLLEEKYNQMLIETEEMEEKVHRYKALGPEFEKIRKEYEETEEQIVLKEWVLEQLASVAEVEDSLLNDSSLT